MPFQKNIIIIDANVILRYLLKDNEEFYEKVLALFDDVLSGKKKSGCYILLLQKWFMSF